MDRNRDGAWSGIRMGRGHGLEWGVVREVRLVQVGTFSISGLFLGCGWAIFRLYMG